MKYIIILLLSIFTSLKKYYSIVLVGWQKIKYYVYHGIVNDHVKIFTPPKNNLGVNVLFEPNFQIT